MKTVFAFLLSLVICSFGFAVELTENNASSWGTFASDGATTSVTNDTTKVKVGAYSLKFTTLSGFDTGIKYPKTGSAHLDISGYNYLVYWAYSVNNTTYQYQGNQPVIKITTPTGTVTLTANGCLMYNKVWHLYHIPLDGSSQWIKTTTGTPNMADVLNIEIHQDTWDYGFSIYYDGMEFVSLSPGQDPPAGPAPPPGVNPDAVEARVLLYIYDPIREDHGGIRLHQLYNWGNAVTLTNSVISDFRASSHDLARYQVIETVWADEYPKFKDGHVFTDAEFDYTWTNRVEYGVNFDYAAFTVEKGVQERVLSGDIDEVWIYAMPFTGMWESNMVGNGGYWCNSGPTSLDTCDRLHIAMGWNYERGVAEAIHSWGHRAESIMVHSYGSWQANESNAWNKFTLLNKNIAGSGNIGNCHFPVNGTSDYDYANTSYVSSNCDDWYTYPTFPNNRRSINFREWSPTNLDPHRDYLKWWYNHMPHMSGEGPDNYLMNWWRYMVDVDQFKGWDGNLYFSSGIPSVTVIGPANGTTVSGITRIYANASADGALGRVDFYVDGVYHGTDTLSPYWYDWNTAGLTGSHTITAKAYELQTGTEAVSSPVTVTAQSYTASGTITEGAVGVAGVNVQAVGTVQTYSRSSFTTTTAIPDNNTNGIFTYINVPTSGTITSVTVGVSVDHPRKADLQVYLRHPDGTNYTLHDRSGGVSPDILTFYPTTTSPITAFTSMNGKSSNGSWQLQVKDRVTGNTGNLLGWSLTIGYNATVTQSATTDSSGNYTITNLPAAAYTVTPTKTGYTFSPTTRGITVGPNATAVNYTATSLNTAPVLNPIGNKTINQFSTLSFSATANDTDVPAQTLTYSLDAGAPTGASINPTSGAFTWTPNETQTPNSYPITIRVTDNGSPAKSDFETISVTVQNPLPTAVSGIFSPDSASQLCLFNTMPYTLRVFQNGSLVETVNGNTSADGGFSANVTTRGAADLCLKLSNALSVKFTGVSINGGTINLGTVTVMRPDLLDDDVIDDFDLNEINGGFGNNVTPGYGGDFNCDGVYDDFDLNQVNGSFGASGACYGL